MQCFAQKETDLNYQMSLTMVFLLNRASFFALWLRFFVIHLLLFGDNVVAILLPQTNMRAKLRRVDIRRRAEMPVAAKTMVSSSMEWFMMRW